MRPRSDPPSARPYLPKLTKVHPSAGPARMLLAPKCFEFSPIVGDPCSFSPSIGRWTKELLRPAGNNGLLVWIASSGKARVPRSQIPYPVTPFQFSVTSAQLSLSDSQLCKPKVPHHPPGLRSGELGICHKLIDPSAGPALGLGGELSPPSPSAAEAHRTDL